MNRTRWVNALFLLSALLYIFIYVNVPITLIPGGMHDDGFFMLRGMSIVAGDWMGAYNQYTLIKGAGYPMFLAAASYFHVPATLAHALLIVLAAWLAAIVTRKLFRPVWISVAVFELVLWNVGPDSTRIVRDAIYAAQFMLALSLLPLAFLATGRRRWALAGAAGIAIGWFFITREEGMVSVPAFLLIGAYFLVVARRNGKRVFQGQLALAGVCAGCALLLPLLVSARNYRRYLKFETVDTQGDFAGAISALESIEQAKERPYLAISREVREKAYAVSPTFASLRPLIDDPGAPLLLGWKNAGCQFLPATCGDYGVGWFMWGLRDAAAIQGAFADAHASSAFFHAITTEVEAACSNGRLACHHAALPLMPHVTADEWQLFPASFDALVRRVLFLEAPVTDSGASVGTLEQMRDAAAFTNVYNFKAAPTLAPAATNPRFAHLADKWRGNVIRIYSWVLPVLLPVGFLVFLGCLTLAVQRRACPLALVMVSAAWIAVILRLAVLATINVTSFGTVSSMYVSLAYPASCFAALLALPLLPQMLAAYRSPKVLVSMPKGFRGVGESERKAAI